MVPQSRRAAGVALGRKAPLCMEGSSFGWREILRGMSEENVALARKAIDALDRGEFDALLAFLSPDVVWGGPGRCPWDW